MASLSPRAATMERITASAAGDRQMFPMHTKRILTGSRSGATIAGLSAPALRHFPIGSVSAQPASDLPKVRRSYQYPRATLQCHQEQNPAPVWIGSVVAELPQGPKVVLRIPGRVPDETAQTADQEP